MVRVSIGAIRRCAAWIRECALKVLNRDLRQIFEIKSHLTAEERIALLRLAEGRRVVCEIGSYVGASACCFGLAMSRSGAGKILCIDTWNNDAMSEGNRDTYAEFRKNTQPYTRFIVPVRGFSTNVIEQVASHAKRVDVLFIDGDHSYEGVKADWEAYKHLLGAGSVVVFHDCGWAEGVQRVIEEDAMPLVGHCARLPNMWWGTIRAQ